MQTSVLPTDYYLANFGEVLETVAQSYGHLLSDAEQGFMDSFRELPRDAQRLWVRLIMRRGPHFRDDKLHYEEIESIARAAEALEAAGLLGVNLANVGGDVPFGISLLLRDELVELLLDHGLQVSSGMRKPELLAACLGIHSEQLELWLQRRFEVFTVLQAEILPLLTLLFFGNRHQSLSEFIIADLGILVYEAVDLERELLLFQSREHIDLTLKLGELSDLQYALAEVSDQAQVVPLMEDLIAAVPDSDHPLVRERHDKILNRAGRFFERQGDLDQALACHQRATLPPARGRQAMILEKLDRIDEAWDLCQAMSHDPLDEEEREAAQRMRPRLQRALGQKASPNKRLKPPVEKLTLDLDDIRVERAVMQHYRAQGFQTIYSENVFWLGLFGLAFWDIIFMPIRGAFLNRFQRGPRDLFTPDFRRNRARAVDDRLEALKTDLVARVGETLQAKVGIANDLVHWPYFERIDLPDLLPQLPWSFCGPILTRLSRDLKANRNGLPDLLVIRDDGPRLVEVKGPGDQLQNNQRRWMRWFEAQGIPYHVAQVSRQEP